MLDFSDHMPANDSAAADDAANLPVIGLPEPGTLVRHFRGAIFRVEGACGHHETADVAVMYRALDPLDAANVRMCPVGSFFSPATAGVPRFTRLRTVDRTKLRAYLPEELVSDAVLKQVLHSYDEPWRFFHTQDHVYGMFELAAKRRMQLSAEQALAILFHDVVYVPGAPEGVNERQSVTLAQVFKAGIRAEVDWTLVGRIIEDTATHKARQPESVPVLDLDLSSLGDDAAHFAAANELVWLENRHLLPAADARKDFDTRRLRFLLALAERGPLFSPAFADYETAARDNLESLRQAWVRLYGDK